MTIDRNQIKRYSLVVLGSVIAGCGVELIVIANIGFDSISTLILGILNVSKKILPISFGTWSQILSGLFLIIAFILNRKVIGVGSILNGILMGGTINLFSLVASKILPTNHKLLLAMCGFLLMAYGTALYLTSNMGSGPMEALMNCLVMKYEWSIRKSRILLDLSLIVAGYLMGGTFGIATIFAIFGLGPLIQFFVNLLYRFQSSNNVRK